VEDGEMPTEVISEREAGRVKRREREIEDEVNEGGGDLMVFDVVSNYMIV
jgi:hypothetical protein